MRDPTKIIGSIIPFVSINMVNLVFIFWSMAVERFTNKNMNKEILFYAFLP